ncbi:MAG TPA: non-heme iron oxygenase ferredoxin subunit [Acidimicrobiales bacterium]|jgi:3-phenylpropionate/trans-cinnamate dioxygenase ferredoxin component|nr:non-heme iron oxygenase ferredoxin subunit [Acidimicrobiales bacterium]
MSTSTSSTPFRVCAVDDVEPGSAKRFDVEGHRLCVVRIGDDFYAIADRCSHEDYSLAEGEVFEEEREIECWKHGSTFSLTDGEPQSLPATKPVAVYDVKVDGDDVLVSARSVV